MKRRIILLLPLCFGLLGTLKLAEGEDLIKIDVVINIMSTTQPTTQPVVSEADARKAVEEANKILKQAGVELNVVKVNSDPSSQPCSAGNADGNASIDEPWSEGSDVQEEGNKELDRVVGGGQGLKITFVKVPWEGVTMDDGHPMPGWSRHENRTIVVTPVTTGPCSGPSGTGVVAGHEWAHVLTLCAGHVVDGSTSQPTTADEGGHSSGPDDLMNPTWPIPSTNRVLTTSQIGEIRRKARELGRVVTTTSAPASQPAAQPKATGGAQDKKGDAGSYRPVEDIYDARAFNCCGEPLIDLTLTVPALFDPYNSFITVYYWLFNTDGLPTGVSIFGVEGVDADIAIFIAGNGSGSLSNQVIFMNEITGHGEALDPAILKEQEFFDWTGGPAIPEHTTVKVLVDYALLGLSAEFVPMTVVSMGDDAPGPVDYLGFLFDTLYEAHQPQLSIYPPTAHLGEMVAYDGQGFTPGSAASLFLDGALVDDTLLVNSDGTLCGYFLLDQLPPPPENFAFVVVQEDTGRSGFTVLQVVVAGACCLTDGTCLEMLTADDCAALGGLFQGVGTTCTPNLCSEGNDCFVPKVVVLPDWGLPHVNTNTTCGRFNDYWSTCLGSYDGGEDILYELILTADQSLMITAQGVTPSDDWIGMAIDTVCPPGPTCLAHATSSGTTARIDGIHLAAGTYYIMVDSWPAPYCLDFTFTIEAMPQGACCIAQNCIGNMSAVECSPLGGSWFVGQDCATFTCPPGCQHRIDLHDCYGDGWNGNTLDVFVNGILVMGDITLTSGHGPQTYYFLAGNGQAIQTVYKATGGWPYEPYYFIYDGVGREIARDGITADGSDCNIQPTGVTVGANCVPATGACCGVGALSCAVLDPVVCAAAGGIYLGDFTMCSGQDCNLNGLDDACDIAGGAPDCNQNGVPDECDIAGGTSLDGDCNGVPDECDPDCNDNGIPDVCEIPGGCAVGNCGLVYPQECGQSQDCQANGIPDECELENNDCDVNGVPDECQPDTDGDGLIDPCDPCPNRKTGDVSGDALVDFGDIGPFVNVLLDPAGAGADDSCAADVDGSGAPDGADVQPFVSLLVS
jgi:hypothetical protein